MEWKDIATKFGTPFYLYDEQQIVKNIAIIREALKGVSHRIMYSLKANSNIYLLSILRSQGVGADVVSIGELRTAILAGFQLQDITFAGVGKRADEI
ncbi:MAG: diaminopimelate decarboxylase, partial [Candidatus Hydrothermae bacterium]|nr:diaminopimelate decarboxylase [Candidatus Hydrothermae bacterium]